MLNFLKMVGAAFAAGFTANSELEFFLGYNYQCC